MIKKIVFFLLLLSFTFSCGKKGDPEYKEKSSKITNTKIIVVS